MRLSCPLGTQGARRTAIPEALRYVRIGNIAMSQPFGAAETLRARLRIDLRLAMKTREIDAVAVLRSVIAAIDNAEAVEAPARGEAIPYGGIAGAQAGVGSTEVARRDLSDDELRVLLTDQVAERLAAAGMYEARGRQALAIRLRREADLLRTYLA